MCRLVYFSPGPMGYACIHMVYFSPMGWIGKATYNGTEMHPVAQDTFSLIPPYLYNDAAGGYHSKEFS